VIELAEIFHLHGSAYREKYEVRMLPSHRRAMWDIETAEKRSWVGTCTFAIAVSGSSTAIMGKTALPEVPVGCCVNGR